MTDCIFCRIASGELGTTLLYDENGVIAFRDLHPRAPTHVLVIPKRHLVSVAAAQPADAELLGQLLLAATEVARQLGIIESGFRLVANCGADGGQTVSHLHVHLLGGRAMGWPPG